MSIRGKVAVVGIGRAVDDPEELALLESLPLQPWAPGPKPHFIRIMTDIVSGRRIPKKS